ncbi:site-2 protease family protein [Snodgrassella sp. ESL0323]|uniref:site-2 protease family protein n=1 Tax=Snodgrassella sp. ESL0323 TaxID=2705034 RepID=UPI001582C6C3|nr:site-2 protease family protein [Snodgrassella sp. ESL0323]NUF79653.1 site-2 protease family protein [Snodgrassella sp. ESL0323]
MLKFDLAYLLLAILPILLGITLPAAVCGYMARFCGDRTAETMGRLSLNPAKYIDIVGTIIIPLATMILLSGFLMVGWAKPVPIDPRNFKNRRQGERLVAIASPLANLLMCLCWTIVVIISRWVPEYFQEPLAMMGIIGVRVNAMFCFFSLLPIPPQPGARFIDSFLSPKASMEYRKLEPYGTWIILLLIVSGIFSFILRPFLEMVTSLMFLIINLF